VRIFHQRGCFVSIGGTLSEFTPDAITGTVQLAGTATNVEGPLAGHYDAVKHRWYVNGNAALYADGTQYEVEWAITRGASTYGVTEYFDGWLAGSAMDTAAPGAATIRVLPQYADTDSITVAFTPPAAAHYDHATITALPATGGTPVEVTATVAANVVIPGLDPATAFLLIVETFSAIGVAGPIESNSWALASTLSEAMPTNWASIALYMNDEAEVHEFGPWYFGPDQEAGKSFAVDNCGLFRVMRERIECPTPVAHLRIDALGFHVTGQQPLTGEPTSDKGG
jgi:hypothetical protein